MILGKIKSKNYEIIVFFYEKKRYALDRVSRYQIWATSTYTVLERFSAQNCPAPTTIV